MQQASTWDSFISVHLRLYAAVPHRTNILTFIHFLWLTGIYNVTVRNQTVSFISQRPLSRTCGGTGKKKNNFEILLYLPMKNFLKSTVAFIKHTSLIPSLNSRLFYALVGVCRTDGDVWLNIRTTRVSTVWHTLNSPKKMWARWKWNAFNRCLTGGFGILTKVHFLLIITRKPARAARVFKDQL